MSYAQQYIYKDVFILFSGKKGQIHNSKKKDVNPNVQEWALGACHRCLVYLGDIGK